MPSITPDELSRAVAILARHLNEGGVTFTISGGAANSLLLASLGHVRRVTEDIDLVVQPDPANKIDVEAVSEWLLKKDPAVFGEKKLYGVSMPTLIFVKDDKSTVHIDIEMFDVIAWPERPQYDLSNSANEQVTLMVEGVPVRVFAASWQLREKIVTAHERHGSQKMKADLADVQSLLPTVEYNSLDMSQHEDAVLHTLTQRPELRELLQVKIFCPAVLGDPWTWHDEAYVFVRFEEGIPWYLDGGLKRHRFKWDAKNGLYYLYTASGSCFYIDEDWQLVQWVD
ncbi:hypothetical protein O1611_g1014 [Lasiodiplodia mahajangana]|uniref:Uncharacterized protein n=1 Tax=Lasiodiplodia mahajangana TaxID=1108764 RepID=A0ACC2JZI2_9PEZI|nr:hypothetical protein O1611_g1014 [Lasiodiplodia mahajangana]